MIGVDLTRISRFKNMENKYAKRFLSNEEFKKYEKNSNKEMFLATRWAIKEAIYKADNNFVSFKKINIKLLKCGRYEFDNFFISTSSENDLLIAFVVKKD